MVSAACLRDCVPPIVMPTQLQTVLGTLSGSDREGLLTPDLSVNLKHFSNARSIHYNLFKWQQWHPSRQNTIHIVCLVDRSGDQQVSQTGPATIIMLLLANDIINVAVFAFGGSLNVWLSLARLTALHTLTNKIVHLVHKCDKEYYMMNYYGVGASANAHTRLFRFVCRSETPCRRLPGI